MGTSRIDRPLTFSNSLAMVSMRLTHSFCIPSSICASGSGSDGSIVGFPVKGVDGCAEGVTGEGDAGLLKENAPPGVVAEPDEDGGFCPNNPPEVVGVRLKGGGTGGCPRLKAGAELGGFWPNKPAPDGAVTGTVEGFAVKPSLDAVGGVGAEEGLVEGAAGKADPNIDVGLVAEVSAAESAEGFVPNKLPAPNALDKLEGVGGVAGAMMKGLGFGIGGAKVGSRGGVLGRKVVVKVGGSVLTADGGAATFSAVGAGDAGLLEAFASFSERSGSSFASSPEIGAFASGELRVGLVEGLPSPRLDDEGAAALGIGETTGGELGLSAVPFGVLFAVFLSVTGFVSVVVGDALGDTGVGETLGSGVASFFSSLSSFSSFSSSFGFLSLAC